MALRFRHVCFIALSFTLLAGCRGSEKTPPDADFFQPIGSLRMNAHECFFDELPLGNTFADTIWFFNPDSKSHTLHAIPGDAVVRFSPVTLSMKPGEKLPLVVSTTFSETSQIGSYMSFTQFEVDQELDYRRGLVVRGAVVENFSTLSEAEWANAPVLVVVPDTFDFGVIHSRTEKQFLLRNDGGRDLIIRHITTTCGCTVATPDRSVIPAGEETLFTVAFDPKGRDGVQNKEIVIQSNDPRHRETKIRVTARVEFKNNR